MSIHAFDLNSDGVCELITGWSNGKVSVFCWEQGAVGLQVVLEVGCYVVLSRTDKILKRVLRSCRSKPGLSGESLPNARSARENLPLLTSE